MVVTEPEGEDMFDEEVIEEDRPRRAHRERSEGKSAKRTGISQFLREVRDEMRQVAWPTRTELINYTAVVLTTLVIMISLIFLHNFLYGKFILFLFHK